MQYHLESVGGGWIVADERGRIASELLRTRSAAEFALLYVSRDLPVTERADVLARVNGLER